MSFRSTDPLQSLSARIRFQAALRADLVRWVGVMTALGVGGLGGESSDSTPHQPLCDTLWTGRRCATASEISLMRWFTVHGAVGQPPSLRSAHPLSARQVDRRARGGGAAHHPPGLAGSGGAPRALQPGGASQPLEHAPIGPRTYLGELVGRLKNARRGMPAATQPLTACPRPHVPCCPYRAVGHRHSGLHRR